MDSCDTMPFVKTLVAWDEKGLGSKVGLCSLLQALKTTMLKASKKPLLIRLV